MNMITAKKVYQDILDMPLKERERLFIIIAKHGFEKEFYTHDEVFADLKESPFTVKESAEYLEVAEITVRRLVKENKLKAGKLGKNLTFDVDELRSFKRKKDIQ